MPKPTLIAFDLDGTLLDFVECFKRFMAHKHNKLTLRTHEDVRSYWTFLSDLYPEISNDHLHKMLDDFFEHETYANMAPAVGAVEAVAAIRRAFPEARCIGISSVYATPAQHQVRLLQLAPFGLDDFIAVGMHASKAPVLKTLGASVLFDDSPEQIDDAEKLGLPAILVHQPWNKNHATPHRLHAWPEAVKAIHQRLTHSD